MTQIFCVKNFRIFVKLKGEIQERKNICILVFSDSILSLGSKSESLRKKNEN